MISRSFDSVMESGLDCLKAVRHPDSLECMTQEAADLFVKEIRVFEDSRVEAALNFTEDIRMMERIVSEVGQNG